MCLVFLIIEMNNCKIGTKYSVASEEQYSKSKNWKHFLHLILHKERAVRAFLWASCTSLLSLLHLMLREVIRCWNIFPSFKGKPNTYMSNNCFNHYPFTWSKLISGEKTRLFLYLKKKKSEKPALIRFLMTLTVLIAEHQPTWGHTLDSSTETACCKRLKYGCEALEIWKIQSRIYTVWSGEEG